MKDSPSIDGPHRVRLHSGRWLVSSQMTLSLVVLVVAGLFLRSFVKLVTLDIGFDRTNVLITHAQARADGAPPEKRSATWDEIERRLASLPGITSVGRSVMTPISGSEWNQLLHADSPNSPGGDVALTYLNSVSPGYFQTLRIPLVAGRDFDAQDTGNALKVAIINQVAARRFYPDLDPVGRFFRWKKIKGNRDHPFRL
ncbi:MAG: ABC transporter permease [Acidobacteriota bacterium]